MRTKPYYSIRTSKNPLDKNFDLDTVRNLFQNIFYDFTEEGYFQETLGYECVDAGFIPGTLGHDLDGAILLELRKKNLTPIRTRIIEYTEEDMFDMIEFLYEHCSKPIERDYHNFNQCGWHCRTFDQTSGKMDFRNKINKVLALYDRGYELSNEGEILSLVDNGLEGLLEAPLPGVDPQNVLSRVQAARIKFLRYRSSLDERRDAIRDLVDVLEFLRPQLKQTLIQEDERDLFNIANNFGIRHHRENQKTNYDKAIFYSWMFYYYLTTIHAVVRLIERQKKILP